MIGVIGGSGFIDGALVRALQRACHDVRIIDRAPSHAYPDAWIEADVRDREALLQACRGCDVLYNLAAEHRDDVRPVELYHQVNVLGALHTCEVAEQLGIDRVIFTSTVAVYGMQEGETDETAPRTGIGQLAAPDVIVGSSPHLFGAFAAWRLARSLCVPFVLEVRDLCRKRWWSGVTCAPIIRWCGFSPGSNAPSIATPPGSLPSGRIRRHTSPLGHHLHAECASPCR